MAAQYSNSIGYGHKKIYVYRKNNPGSGTTVRNVQHGLNALNNIKNIKQKLIVRTERTERAADWHIWKNNFNLLVFIEGANAKKEHKLKYKEALTNVRSMAIDVFIYSHISAKRKLEIIGLSIFPRTAAKCAVSLKKYLFKRDQKNQNL